MDRADLHAKIAGDSVEHCADVPHSPRRYPIQFLRNDRPVLVQRMYLRNSPVLSPAATRQRCKYCIGYVVSIHYSNGPPSSKDKYFFHLYEGRSLAMCIRGSRLVPRAVQLQDTKYQCIVNMPST